LKPRKFDLVAAIKDASRTHIGIVPATRFVPHKNRRRPKHKDTLRRLLERD
jgi:hypothetical protein